VVQQGSTNQAGYFYKGEIMLTLSCTVGSTKVSKATGKNYVQQIDIVV